MALAAWESVVKDAKVHDRDSGLQVRIGVDECRFAGAESALLWGVVCLGGFAV